MDIRPLRNDADRDAAIREIDRLWGAPDGSKEADTLDVLATLVHAYDEQHYPIEKPTPLEFLQYAVTDMGRSQKELADVLGSRSLASEILAGKRRISLEAAQKISAAWSVPIQLLVAPHKSKAA